MRRVSGMYVDSVVDPRTAVVGTGWDVKGLDGIKLRIWRVVWEEAKEYV